MAPWSTGKRTATCTYTHPCQLSTGEDPQPTELVQLSTGKEHLHVCTHHDQLARNTHMYSTYRYTLTNWCSYQLPKKPKPIKYYIHHQLAQVSTRKNHLRCINPWLSGVARDDLYLCVWPTGQLSCSTGRVDIHVYMYPYIHVHVHVHPWSISSATNSECHLWYTHDLSVAG